MEKFSIITDIKRFWHPTENPTQTITRIKSYQIFSYAPDRELLLNPSASGRTGGTTAIPCRNFQGDFTSGGHNFLNVFMIAIRAFRVFIIYRKYQSFKFFAALFTFKLIYGHSYKSPYFDKMKPGFFLKTLTDKIINPP
jgi:hypothetical protein